MAAMVSGIGIGLLFSPSKKRTRTWELADAFEKAIDEKLDELAEELRHAEKPPVVTPRKPEPVH